MLAKFLQKSSDALLIVSIFSSTFFGAFSGTLTPFSVPFAEAAFNAQMNYQGKLVNASNVTVADGTYHMKFWLLTSPTAATTTALWTEDRSTAPGDRITVTNGLFSVMLGSSTPLTTVDFNQTLYLGVEIGGSSGSPSWDGEMSPRKILGTVPAAFESSRVDGLSSEQFLRHDAVNSTSTATTFLTVTQNGAGNIASFLGPSSANVLEILSGGKIGIGTTTPNNKLDIYSTTQSAIGFSGASGSTYKWAIGMDVTNGGRFSIASSTALGTTDRFVIDGDGDVGISSSTPGARLSITGAGTSSGKSFSITDSTYDENLTFLDSGNLGLGITTPTSIFHVVGPSISGTGGTSATTALTITGGAGANKATGGTAGTGGGGVFTAGNGGAGSSGDANGGTGGAFSFTTGTGGAGIGAGNGGTGGAYTITAGTGGASGASALFGGTGGALTFTSGAGGTGDTGGNGGNISIIGGDAGTSGFGSDGTGGNIYIYGGSGQTTGTVGNVNIAVNSGGVSRGKLIAPFSTLTYASSTAITVSGTNGLTLGSLNGPLQANNGTVSATTSIGVLYGGTGLTSAPSYGNILVGNSSNGYTLTATSSLGLITTLGGQYSTGQTGSTQTFATSSADANLKLTITSSGNTHTFTPSWNGTLAVSRGGTGASTFGGTNTLLYTTAADTLSSITTANSSILITNGSGVPSWGTTLPAFTLGGDITGNSKAITGLNNFTVTGTTNATSTISTGGLTIGTNQFVVQQTSGYVGIGTTSPYARLSVVGETVASHFTATTTATSTLPYLRVTNNLEIGSSGEFIHQPTNGTIRMTPFTSSGATGDCYLNADLTSWGFGVSLSTGGGSNCSTIRYTSTPSVGSDVYFGFGNGNGGRLNYSSVGNDTLQLGIYANTAGYSGATAILNPSHLGDADRSPAYVFPNPTLVVYSNDAAQAGDYLGLTHDQTNAKLFWLNGDLRIDPFTPSGNIILSTTTSTMIGVGTTSPWRKLSVTGTVGLSSTLTSASTGNFLCINTATYEVTSGTTCAASSIRFKENIQSLTYGLDAINALRPVSFTYKPSVDPDGRVRIGLIAEEVAEIIPELVDLDEEGLPESVDYAKLTSVIISAIKELSARVTNLGDQIAALAGRVTNLEQSAFGATSTPAAVLSIGGVLDGLQNLGAHISESFAGFRGLAADTFTLGSSERPAGVTLYDEESGEPYCLKIKNGRIKSVRGECDDGPDDGNPGGSDHTGDDLDEDVNENPDENDEPENAPATENEIGVVGENEMAEDSTAGNDGENNGDNSDDNSDNNSDNSPDDNSASDSDNNDGNDNSGGTE